VFKDHEWIRDSESAGPPLELMHEICRDVMKYMMLGNFDKKQDRAGGGCGLVGTQQ